LGWSGQKADPANDEARDQLRLRASATWPVVSPLMSSMIMPAGFGGGSHLTGFAHGHEPVVQGGADLPGSASG
jgi:hypothetical protein